MFLVTEDDAAAIRTAFNEDGELSAAIELRRRFKGITTTSRRVQWLGRLLAGSLCRLGQSR